MYAYVNTHVITYSMYLTTYTIVIFIYVQTYMFVYVHAIFLYTCTFHIHAIFSSVLPGSFFVFS